MPINIPMAFFMELGKNANIHMEAQKFQNSQSSPLGEQTNVKASWYLLLKRITKLC